MTTNGTDPRDRDTLPPPGDEDLPALMRELNASLVQCSELAVRVANRLTLLEIAELTAEHRINSLTDRASDHEARLRRLEGHAPDTAPAEPAE